MEKTKWFMIEYHDGDGYHYNDFMGKNTYEAIGRCIVANPCAIIQKIAIIINFSEIGDDNA
jgi:hypothetical protein